ncbi:2-oxo-4-hydroxy-4-carboxy-5-ureidoimidazoline decarboxylase [Sphingomonas sp. LB-2]|uniref:2-oxo-4-hydroxy-4-carboxy-5-ureidoimidazoline decarboxylase n=1 Tax=Sphingomonas caeni TaxID=2984949 RepID=UPI00223242CB|nr:2-oxo-4-hydroxy-4-carboxy-5-ureidoimidazoline decarboxylase [Sphingomonas caeni]MCW3846642.1 2-oxo-4-hydroxy-4-carboxy-5-ureidoimidazoline decarboxylase [Sphingomonas caeni]
MPADALTRDAFVARFGPVYEASPWVAEAVWPAAARGELDDPAALAQAMRDAVDAAPHDRKLALIRAHPQLAVAGRMAEASVQEQRGAGLDQCTPEELEAFRSLNAAYLARFGHPFIIAVKGLSRGEILAAFAARMEHDPETEFATAIAQINRIAGFRIAAFSGLE